MHPHLVGFVVGEGFFTVICGLFVLTYTMVITLPKEWPTRIAGFSCGFGITIYGVYGVVEGILAVSHHG